MGTPHLANGGGTPFPGQDRGVPHPGRDVGGTPSRSGCVGYPLPRSGKGGGTPSQVRTVHLPKLVQNVPVSQSSSLSANELVLGKTN